jgi:SP family sugar:H+ symporter-like MFS transporter
MTLDTSMAFLVSVKSQLLAIKCSYYLGMDYVIHTYTGLPYSDSTNTDLWTIPASKHSLIVSILSAGTFFGALFSGDCADFFGRRRTIIGACAIFLVGVIMQTASTEFKLLAAGRAIAGLG